MYLVSRFTSSLRYTLAALYSAGIFFISNTALAQTNTNLVETVSVTASASTCTDKYGLCKAAGGLFSFSTVDSFIGNLILAVLGFVGIVFLVLIIYGGISWMTSGGNEQRIEKAKKILTTASIGLVIIILGYSITYFVVDSLSGAVAQPSGGTLRQGT